MGLNENVEKRDFPGKSLLLTAGIELLLSTGIDYHELGFHFDSLNFLLLLTHIGLAKHRKVKTEAFILEFETETLKQGIPYYSIDWRGTTTDTREASY